MNGLKIKMMEIYKFIENYKYEAKPNYMKLPKSTKMHLESKDEEYGECWCIVLPKDFYYDNFQNIFPKYYNYYVWRFLNLGDYVFTYVSGILSDNWESMSDEDFYKWIDDYTNQFYIITNIVNHNEYVEEIEASQWDIGTYDPNVRFVKYTDDTRKTVNVHRYESILTPISVSKLIKIRNGVADVFNISWKSDKQDNSIGYEWCMERNKVPIDKLLHCLNTQYEYSIVTDSKLFEEKKKYIIDNII